MRYTNIQIRTPVRRRGGNDTNNIDVLCLNLLLLFYRENKIPANQNPGYTPGNTNPTRDELP